MGIEAEAPQEISGLIHWWHLVLTHRNSQEGSQRREIGVQDDRNCIIPQLDGLLSPKKIDFDKTRTKQWQTLRLSANVWIWRFDPRTRRRQGDSVKIKGAPKGHAQHRRPVLRCSEGG